MPQAVPLPGDERALLALWERALALDAPAREAWLANEGGALEPAATLGEQRARLLRSLAPWCDRRLTLRSRCPRCGEAVAFEVDPAALAASAAPAGDEFEFDEQGWQVRFGPLAPADIDAVLRAVGESDEAAFVQALLARSVRSARRRGADQPAAGLPVEIAERLVERLEALDPLASIAFEVACPQCDHAWQAPFDAGSALWMHVQSAAERLLTDIDALARRYGWSEQQILSLGPTRRRAYLQLAGLA
jgi:hypothetical protein